MMLRTGDERELLLTVTLSLRQPAIEQLKLELGWAKSSNCT
jgi:hypothetical protein